MGFAVWLVLCIILWGVIPAIQAKRRRAEGEALGRQARRQIIAGIAGMLAKMAKADGHVSRVEGELARSYLQRMQLSPEEYRHAVGCFNAARDDAYSIDHYARLFTDASSPEARQLVYDMLWSIAGVDGQLDAGEDRLLRRVVLLLGLDDSLYFYYRRLHFGGGEGSGRSGGAGRRSEAEELARAYSRLGCSASDSDDAVRAAYRTQAMKYHPDRLRAEGLPEGMLERATKTMAEINAAWDRVRASRGMS